MIHIMGIVNLTPDSFYQGSRTSVDAFMPKVRQMIEDGADVIDIGACSTRPGAPRPSVEEEWARLEPALSGIAGYSVPGACAPTHKSSGRGPQFAAFPTTLQRLGRPEGAERPESPGMEYPAISIDTYRPEIVRRAYDIIGPFIVNDVAGGEPEMLKVVGELGLPYIAMHPKEPVGDVIEDQLAFFNEFDKRAQDAGVKDWILDPGFGFGKTIGQNYEILRRLEELHAAGRDILVGISRKSMIYKVLGITPDEAMPETLALEMIALQKGATWLRVHDVAPTARMVKIYSTMYTSSPGAAK